MAGRARPNGTESRPLRKPVVYLTARYAEIDRKRKDREREKWWRENPPPRPKP